MEDNLYPQFGAPYMPTQTNSQSKEAEQERQNLIDQLPLIKKVIERLDSKITFYDMLDSIQVDINTDPATFQKVHFANQMTRNNLITERAWLQSLIDKHKG